jgi:hypothetical protein
MSDAQVQTDQMEAAQPQKEHEWLQKLVGDWRSEAEMPGQDGTSQKHEGTTTFRSLGGLWIVGEGHGETPGGTDSSVMTLGYDPGQRCYVGTFISGMMTHLWQYRNGRVEGNRLTLEAEGPRFDGSGGMTLYKDSITFEDDDHHVLTSEVRGDDGSWQQFMRAEYYRK